MSRSLQLWSVILLAMSGCAVTGKSATVDSTSKMPFFNMEVGPRSKTPAPETTRISRDGSIPLEPEPAKLVVNGSNKDSSWWQRLKGTNDQKTVPIKLPRTDIVEVTPKQSKTDPPAPRPDEPIEF